MNLFKVASTIVVAGVVAVFGAVGYTFFQGYKAANMSPETVQKLADQIVDPNVSASQLERQGFYNVSFGGFYLDDCRREVLTDAFNQNLTNASKADKISNCIYKRAVETASRSAVTIRNY